jgi:hypothetical protein
MIESLADPEGGRGGFAHVEVGLAVLDVLAHFAAGDDEDWAWAPQTLLSNRAARLPSRKLL